MAFQAIIRYHCDLMSDYRTIDWREFDSKEQAQAWINKKMKELIPFEEDPENPVSDLYDTDIQEV